MQFLIKIGYLIPFIVVRKDPDKNAYLVHISGTDLFALLPKTHAAQDYKIGDSGWAAVFQVKGATIFLSQKSPQYIRKILEYFFRDILTNYGLQIKKVAIFQNLFKILIKTDRQYTNKELNEIFHAYVKNSDEIKKYFPEGKFVFVRYKPDIEDLIASLLVFEEKISRVIYFRSLGQATVYTENGSVGILVGEKGKNLITAKKILQSLVGNIDIEIKSNQGGH